MLHFFDAICAELPIVHSVCCPSRTQDSAQRDRVAAKNGLESYAFNIKNTVDDEKLKDKISPEDKATITSKCEEVLKWLDMNQVCCEAYMLSALGASAFF